MRIAKDLKCWEYLVGSLCSFWDKFHEGGGERAFGKEVTRKSHLLQAGRICSSRKVSENSDKHLSQVVFSCLDPAWPRGWSRGFPEFRLCFADFMAVVELSQTFCVVVRTRKVWQNSTYRASGLKMSLPVTAEPKCHRAAVMCGRTDDAKKLHGTLIWDQHPKIPKWEKKI